jgi:multidrug efflux pump subunit AcrA (membrane-fusion protein)
VTARRRRALAAAALAAVALAGRGIWALVRVPPGCVRVERGDLVVGVEITGTLRAVESSVLGPPQIRDVWQFKIAMMADEGAEVAAGDPVLGFDPSELQQNLRTKLADLDAARTEVEKKRVDLAMTEADDRLALAEVEARLRKARLVASHPPELHSSIELAKARLDLELAELEVELVGRRIEATRRAGREELGVIESSLDRVASEVRQIEDGIGRMQRTAPRDGIVIHVTDWRNEKKRVGDTCWVAEPVVEIPDLTRMEADGEVEEAQAGRVREGQSALLRLDAHPDREYAAAVKSLSRAVQEKSWRNPKKVVRLTLSLAETDPERMRPGMRFRGAIEVDRRPDAVLLPVAAVFADRGDTVVYRRGATGWRRTPVELGERTADSVEVLRGVAPGDLVSLRVRP